MISPTARSASERARIVLTGAERRRWPTADGAERHDFTLADEAEVVIAGDWESQQRSVNAIIDRLMVARPDLQTVLHLGDLRYANRASYGRRGARTYPHGNFLPWLDEKLVEVGIRRLLVTPGNHDDWSLLAPRFAQHPGRPFRVGSRIWVLPRGFRFSLGGVQVMSFGGAVSVDHDGGGFEAPSDADVERAAVGGRTDVLLTHEPPSVGATEVAVRIRDGAAEWSAALLARSALSRTRISTLMAATAPTLTFHGHMHVAGRGVDPSSGSKVYALASVVPPASASGSAGLLRLKPLRFRFLNDIEQA